MKYTAVVLLSVVLSACEMVISVDMPPYDPQIVINGFFTSDSLWNIHISNSLSSIDRGELKELENASVLIYRNGALTDTLKFDPVSGYYQSASGKPEPNKSYTIRVSAPGLKNAEAAGWLPYPVSVQSVSIRDSAIIYGSTGYADAELTVTYYDPASQKNYYALSVVETDTTYGDYSYPVYYSTSDPSISEGGASVGFFNDELFDGKLHEMKILISSDYINKTGNTLTVILTSLSEDAYLYNRSYEKHQNARNNPFAEPVQVYTNVKDGLGIFAGFVESRVVVK
jgi:hypothetical protein